MAFFDFLQDLTKEKEVAGKTFGFIKNTGVSVARGVARIPETAARSFIEMQTGAARKKLTGDKDFSSGLVTDPVRRLLYGEEPVQTYQKRAEGYKETLEGSRFRDYAGPLAAGGGLLMAGLDVTPLGPGKAGKDIFKQLAKETTEEGVKKIAAKTGTNLTDDVVKAIASTPDENIVKNIMAKNTARTKALSGLDDVELLERNYVDNLQFAQGEGAQLPTTPTNIDDIRTKFQAEAKVDVPAAQLAEAATPKVTPPEPFEEIGKALEGVRPAAEEQAALLSKERGQRFGRVAQETTEGSDGYFNELKSLKGEYTKVGFEPLINDIGPERAEELFTAARQKIKSTPDSTYAELGLHAEGARLNTQRAVRKVLGMEPGLPTRSEIKLLEVFSPKIAQAAKDARPIGRKIFDAAATLFGNSRSLKSTGDLSMGGRQGLFVSARHPVLWGRANKESVKYAKSKQYYLDEMGKLKNTEWGQGAEKYKVALTGLGGHEEAYAATDVVGKLPIVKRAERAYTGGLTKLRYDLWESRLKAYGSTFEEAEKNLGEKGMQGLAEAINTLTGRGGKQGGFVSKHATTLQEALFSPRLWASRLQPLNPAFWSRVGPAGRKEALESLGLFAGVASIILGAAVASGAEVESDPRSSDFLKVKVGDTRYDILGGFQQNIVFAARQLSGSTKSSQSGKVTQFGEGFGAPTRLTSAFDLVRNKANPVLGAFANILEGKDKAGNEINPLTEIGQLMVPISFQGSYDSIKYENSIKGLAKSAPEYVGIGSQTYGTKSVKPSTNQQIYLDRLKESGASKEVLEANTRLLQTLKLQSGPRSSASEQINKALAKGEIQKAQEIADKHNQKVGKDLQEWIKKYSQGFEVNDEINGFFKQAIINLDSQSINQRINTITTYPEKYGLKYQPK